MVVVPGTVDRSHDTSSHMVSLTIDHRIDQVHHSTVPGSPGIKVRTEE